MVLIVPMAALAVNTAKGPLLRIIVTVLFLVVAAFGVIATLRPFSLPWYIIHPELPAASSLLQALPCGPQLCSSFPWRTGGLIGVALKLVRITQTGSRIGYFHKTTQATTCRLTGIGHSSTTCSLDPVRRQHSAPPMCSR